MFRTRLICLMMHGLRWSPLRPGKQTPLPRFRLLSSHTGFAQPDDHLIGTDGTFSETFGERELTFFDEEDRRLDVARRTCGFRFHAADHSFGGFRG